VQGGELAVVVAMTPIYCCTEAQIFRFARGRWVLIFAVWQLLVLLVPPWMEEGITLRFTLDLSISGRTLLMKVSNAVVTALLWFLGALMVFGCEKRNETVVWTEKADRINDVDFHGIEETKQVAQGA
jgi:hypothetical protein